MKKISWSKKIILMLLLFISSEARSLQFIYLQTDDGKPFYVKLKSKVYSSSENGYLILSKLEEGNYSLVVGFPANQLPSQIFDVELKKDQDRGFEIISNQSSMFSLVDLKTSLPLMPQKDTVETIVKDTIINKKTDEFSRVLALVTDNPSILEEDNFEKNEMSIKQSTQKITRIISKRENAGFAIKYLVWEGEKRDTVDVFVPNETKKYKKENSQEKTICKENAEEADFIQLRRKMTAEDDEKKMISVAKISFAEKCYNTEQIKYLSALFINEEDRIDFLGAAYSSVSDKINFGALESLFTSKKNKIRFRSLLQP